MGLAKASDVAYYLVEKFSSEGKPLTNIKLQKLLYFSWIHFYNRYGGKYLFDDEFSAWRYGPVIDKIYSDYRIYGAMPIYEPLGEKGYIPETVRAFLNDMFREYQDKTASQMVAEAHNSSGAWSQVYRDNEYGISLPFKTIIEYDCKRFSS